MIQFRIHGRGGQGGVTLAKLLATLYWKEGRWVQAFGSYAAERTGAPVQAFVLVDDEPINNRHKVYDPDHLVILDPTLIGPGVLSGLRPGAIITLDTARDPESFPEFPGRRVAAVDASEIARGHGLGTRTTPITSSALIGALARIFDLAFETVEAALEELGFPEANRLAAREAYDRVRLGTTIPGEAVVVPAVEPGDPVPDLVTGNLGTEPCLGIAGWKSRRPVRAPGITSPCNALCPAGNDVQAFIHALARGDADGALEVLRETTPLPGSTSRVCPHFCEGSCTRAGLDGAVNVHALERYAADEGSFRPAPPEVLRPERIAIIGSGPAGLSAAHQLRRRGYGVTIFEAHPEPGGMLRAGIPAFRLPREILRREIAAVEASGVEIRCNASIRSPQEFEALAASHDVVILAVGLGVGQNLDLGDTAGARRIQGIDFLREVQFGEPPDPGPDVIVLGGGNTALDAARTAVRLGARNVTIVYRRTRAEMPAHDDEVAETLAEGVRFQFLHAPRAVVVREGRSFLLVQRMELGDPGPDGRRKPVPVPDAFDEIGFSSLIFAIGQAADLGFLTSDVAVEDGFILTDVNGATSNPRVFAAGDVVTNDGTVTHAIGHGSRVARAVHHALQRMELDRGRRDEVRPVDAARVHLEEFERMERRSIRQRPGTVRAGDFDEVRLGLESVQEAARCLSCGICNGCWGEPMGRCELYCPERAIRRVDGAPMEVDLDNCKGCLLCVEVCPRHALVGVQA